jgi:hypothetical protein
VGFREIFQSEKVFAGGKGWKALSKGDSKLYEIAHVVELHRDVLVRQVIKMLVIVVALFALCWLPLQTYNVLQDIFPQING